MRTIFQMSAVTIILLLASCQQKTTDTKDESSNIPVTEDDKIRYNMNPNHEAIIRSQDSTIMDSIIIDTLQ